MPSTPLDPSVLPYDSPTFPKFILLPIFRYPETTAQRRAVASIQNNEGPGGTVPQYPPEGKYHGPHPTTFRSTKTRKETCYNALHP
jgi:hypothetical protein